MTTDHPRCNQVDKMTPSERAIYDAVQSVEKFGADTRLTEAVVLLQKARDKVADFVDGVESPVAPTREVAAVESLRLALARIKSLEDGIVAENKRTNLLVNELQADVKHYKRGVANWLAKSQGVGRACGGCRGCGDDSSINCNACVGSAWIAPKETLDKVGVDDSELDSIRAMLAETAEDPAAELARLREPNETGAAVSALLSHDKARESSFKAQSRALDAADERGLNAKLVEAERERDAVRDGERVTYAICENLRADQRATGGVLAGILGRERCEDGNVCLANEVALKIEALEQKVHELSHDKACDEILVLDQDDTIKNLSTKCKDLQAACDSHHLGTCYAEEPCGECEAAKQRRTKDSGGSGAAQATAVLKGSAVPPEPAGDLSPWGCKTCGGDKRYGNRRGCRCTAGLESHKPDCEGLYQAVFVRVADGCCTRCNARVRAPDEKANVALQVRMSKDPPKLTELVSREQLIAACKSAALWELSNTGVQSAFKALIRALDKT